MNRNDRKKPKTPERTTWGSNDPRHSLECAQCGKPRLNAFRSRFCSTACRQAAYRRRKYDVAEDTPLTEPSGSYPAIPRAAAKVDAERRRRRIDASFQNRASHGHELKP